MTPQEESAYVHTLAMKAGFDLCGITDAVVIPEAVAHLKSWLQKGFHADMTWMHNPKREDPQKVLQGAKSIIMFALNYYSEMLPEADAEKIARYARGRDYHKIMEKKLKIMTTTLQQLYPHESFLYYVDYGPFSERTYAQKAGLGFIGKNGNLITEEFGSYVLLCEIVTTKHFLPNTEKVRTCGNCTKCLDACPTSAITADRMVDSRKCISYQTIENKAPVLPETIRKQQEGWAFGCDICQEVCPFNNKLRNKERREPDLQPRYTSFEHLYHTLDSDEAFLEQFAGTPIMRPKREGIRRNITSAKKSTH